MVQAREEPTYKKCFVWCLTAGDYGDVRRVDEGCKDLCNPKHDRSKFLSKPINAPPGHRFEPGARWSGIQTLNLHNATYWDQAEGDLSVASIDERFATLAAETQDVLVILYYSGHGAQDSTYFKTCAMLPKLEGGRIQLYPLERALRTLANKSNFFCFGAFDCCRTAISETRQERIPINWVEPRFFANRREPHNPMGNARIVHIVSPGGKLVDSMPKKVATQSTTFAQDDVYALTSTTGRLSFMIPAWLRVSYGRLLEDDELTYDELYVDFNTLCTVRPKVVFEQIYNKHFQVKFRDVEGVPRI